MEQIVHDARSAQIYEGTNGIQAHDLIGRKVLRDGGAALRGLLDSVDLQLVPARFQAELGAAVARLVTVTDSVIARSRQDPALPGAIATDYLDLVGYTLYAWIWARMAQAAPADDFGAAKQTCAEFYFARMLPRAAGLAQSIEGDSSTVMDLPDNMF